MNGKKAKRLRREVREVLGIEYPIQRARKYQESNVGTIPIKTLPEGEIAYIPWTRTCRVHPAEPRAVYQKYKRLSKKVKA